MNDRPEVEAERSTLSRIPVLVIENDADLGLCVFVIKCIQTMTEDSRPPSNVSKRIRLAAMYPS